MRPSRLIVLAVMSMSVVVLSATAGQAKTAKWRTIIGIIEGGNQVGSGSGAVPGGAPWSALGGAAKVDLDTGDIQFQVRGLVLAVGSAPAFSLSGLFIGTPAGVTDVIGTLVCDLDGSAGSGSSTLVDTPSVSLSPTGDAQFTGNVGPLPPSCSNESDIAFLIRIFNPEGFRGAWIANGAVLDH